MKFYSLLSMLVAVSLMLSACSQSKSQTDNMNDNPLFSPSSLPLYAPDFDAIKTKHFRPAFEAGMEQELEEVEEIANNSEAPTFENTIVAMEKSGRLLSRAASVFYNLTSAHTNDQIQEIQKEMAPKLAEHSDQILLNAKLYDRVKTLYDQREEIGLDGAQMKLLEDIQHKFVSAWAELNEDEQQRMREINSRVSSLN